MNCIRCGCSDDNACMTPQGPCSWASIDPPICSACIEAGTAGEAVAERSCPAATSGFHQPLFRPDGSAYCVHCKDELDVPEAA